LDSADEVVECFAGLYARFMERAMGIEPELNYLYVFESAGDTHEHRPKPSN